MARWTPWRWEHEIDKKERADMVRAMDRIVRCVNNEDLFWPWLSDGVADGDVNGTETDEDLEWYYEDERTFADLMGLFLRIMKSACVKNENGGLYCDYVCSREYHDKDLELLNDEYAKESDLDGSPNSDAIVVKKSAFDRLEINLDEYGTHSIVYVSFFDSLEREKPYIITKMSPDESTVTMRPWKPLKLGEGD